MRTGFVLMRVWITCCFLIAILPAQSRVRATEGTADVQQQAHRPISASLTLNAAFPHRPGEWSRLPELADLEIVNPTEHSGSMELTATLSAVNGGVIARSRTFAPPVLTIASGVTHYDATDLFRSLEFEAYNGNERLAVSPDTLPEGAYVLCFNLKPQDRRDSLPPLSHICRGFSVVDLSRPDLAPPLYTWNADSTRPETLVFNWHYPVDVDLDHVQWLFRIVQAGDDKTGADIMEHHPVVFERMTGDSTTFILSGPASYLQPGRRYLWSVRVYEQYSGAAPHWATPAVFMLESGR